MNRIIALVSIVVLCSFSVLSQTNTKGNIIKNPEVIPMTYHGKTEALIDYQESKDAVNEQTRTEKLGYHPKDDWYLNPTVNPNALPQGIDPVLQKDYPTGQPKALTQNFDGMGYTSVNPADPSVEAGPTYVIQMINGGSGSYFEVYDKSGNVVVGQTYFDNFFGYPGGAGDPIVFYDEPAGRWLMTEFSSGGNNMYVAISSTSDPLGTWDTYTFNAPNFPDYPKYSVWANSYIITTNETTSACYALDRANMLAGNPATAQRFDIPNFGTIGFQAATPVNLDGTTMPPAGQPAMVMRMRDDAWTGATSDALEIWEFDIDWVTPANTTLTQTTVLNMGAPFDSELCGYTSFACIPQPGTGTTLDPLREVLMNRIHYRNFGTHESIVCSHVTDVDGTDWAGIRWYELRRTGGTSGSWTIYQEGTYAPDSDNRWMSSIGISASGNIGLMYNVSSSSTYPSLRYTGRKECDPLGVMTEPETTIIAGSGSNASNRYGDYNQLGYDPADGETFWCTGMYNASTQWSTRIAAFTIDPCDPIVQFDQSTYNVNEPDADQENGCRDYQILNVPISIGIDPSQPADITINISGGTATQGEDYDIFNTVNTLDGTNLTDSAVIWIYDDQYVEGPETIILDYTLNANGGDATPGTINQTVTITINDDDLDPASMTNTITVLTEDFESGMAPWTTVNPSGDTPWQVGDEATAQSGAYDIPSTNTTQFAWINDDACDCDQNDVDLISPSFDLTGYTAASLNFDSYFESNTYNGDTETAGVYVSVGGGPFNFVASVVASPIDVDWSNQTVDLSPYVGNANVQIAFNYSDGTGWLYGCTIDNVLITGEEPIGIQTAVNTTAGDTAWLGPNGTVHFYDPASSDVMCTIENTSTFDYGCVVVEVDRDGTTPTAEEFNSTSIPDYLHSKTYRVRPDNNNPTGTYNMTVYYEEAEVTAWETFTGNSRNDAEIIKVAGNNQISDVTPANWTTFTIDNSLATVGAFSSDVIFSAPFSTGFSGFGVGIFNPGTTVSHTTILTDPTCNGSSDGQIEVTASGGTSPYQYSIDGGTTWQSSNIFSGLPAGTYDVIVEDALGTQSTVSTETLNDPAAIVISLVSATNPTCDGACDGTIDVSVTGGNPPYMFNWNSPPSQGPVTKDVTNGCEGTHDLTVTDDNGCTATFSHTLVAPPPLTYSATTVDETCNNADGEINMSASGGTSSYQYSIDGGTTFQASGSFTGLTSGTYNVVVEDANGCQTTGTETVGASGAPTIDAVATTDPTCNGSSDGTIDITASGGTGTLNYSIDGGATFQPGNVFTGLPAGTYNLVVEDANGCQATSTVTLLDPTAVTYTATTTNENCGQADGTITITASGGTGTYSYSIDGGTTFQPGGNYSGLIAGSYNVVVEDGDGCQATGTETVGSTSAPTVDAVNTTDPLCPGNADGTIDITASGGTPTYQYSIDGGTTFQGSSTFTGLASGTYNIVVEDQNGCQGTSSATLTDPTPVTYTATIVDENCGSSDGEINLTGSGGTGTYQYSIDGGVTFQGSGSFTGLIAGNYNVVVEDGNGCQATGTETVGSIGGPSIDAITATDPTCNGDADGEIIISSSGGQNPIRYSIDGGVTQQVSNTFTGLSAGTYDVVVEDGNGCQATQTVTLTDPPLVTYTVASTDETCGQADGTLTLTGSGGTGALQYSIDGGTTFQASGSFTGLTAGTYNVVVEDANGCQTTGTETVGATSGPTIDAVSSIDPTCNGGTDGEISITASGGTIPYLYSIDGGSNFQTGNTFTGLSAGTYNIVVQDDNGCQATSSATLTDPPAVTYTSTITDATCGNADGIIDLTGSGGTSPYQYSIDGGSTFQASGTFSGLPAGSYNVVVEDSDGCQATGVESISNAGAPSIDNITTSDVSCNGANDGNIAIVASGGTGALQYSIDGGTTFQGTGLFTGLSGGTYNIVVEDANGCQATSSVTLNEPPAITYTVTSTPESCGQADGSLDLSASGGTGGFQYSIDGGTTFQASGTFTGLTAGNYNVVIEDGSGCQTTGTETVGAANAPTISSTTSTDVTCNGDADGEITISASGGTGTLLYSIDGGLNFQTSSAFTGLSGGTYNIVVEDANGCQATSTATINEPAVLTVTTSSTDVSCNGICDGAVSATASGGTTPYTYDWLTASGSPTTTSGLCAGNYTLILTDANGCQVFVSETINEPAAITLTVASTDITCNGAGDGTIDITATGGSGTFQYSIDGGTTFQGSGSFTGLSAGTYNIVVEDSDGCQETTTVTVNEPAALTITTSSTDITCNGVNDGTITITASGGTPTIQYSIDGGATFQSSGSFSGLSQGTYTIVAEDGNGCQATGSETISEPSSLTVSVSGTDPTCNGSCDGQIVATPSGGTTPYTYTWNSGGSSSTITNACGGTNYIVTVTDANGCSASASLTLTEPAAITYSVITNPSSCSGANGTIDITASGGTGTFQYSIDGGTTFQVSGSFTGLSSGTYNIVVEDSDGCQVTGTTTVGTSGSISITGLSSTDPLCAGASDGTIDITASGGNPPLQYSVDGGTTFQGTGSFTGLPAGTYNILVEGSGGCQGTGTITLTDPPAINMTSTSTDENCGNFDGTITITANGGTGTMQYSIDGGASFQPSGSFTGLSAGTYNLIIEDANGCQSTGTETITNNPAPTISSTTSTDATCGNTDGSIVINATGGTTPYQYSIDGGTNFQTNNTFNNLGAGVYSIIVEDANGCSAMTTDTVTAFGAPAIDSVSVADVTCNGDGNGTIDVYITGGTSPFDYSIDGGATFQTSSSFTGLGGGTYDVVVEDSAGCSVTSTVTIDEPAALTGILTGTNTTCGMDNGAAVIDVNGGTQPYTYLWSDSLGQSTSSATDLMAGTYTVLVGDANGCVYSDSITIANSDSMSINIEVVHESCTDMADGSISIEVSGGATPYDILWSTGDTTDMINGLTAAMYTVSITDSNGCMINEFVPIETDNLDCVVIPTAISPNDDAANDVWVIQGLDLYPDHKIEVYNRWGNLLYRSEDYQNDWDGTYNGKQLPAGVYYFVVTLEEDDVRTGSITILR